MDKITVWILNMKNAQNGLINIINMHKFYLLDTKVVDILLRGIDFDLAEN